MGEHPVPICEKCVKDPYKLGYTVTFVKGHSIEKMYCIICNDKTNYMGVVRNKGGKPFSLTTIH